MSFYPDELWKIDSCKYEAAFHGCGVAKKYKNNWLEFRRSTIDKLIKGAEKGKLMSMSPNASAFKEMEDWMVRINKGPVETMFRKEY